MKTLTTVAAILAILFTAAAFAQTSGTISGTVSDSTGAVIPGVRVAIRNVDTSERREATSNGAGQYSFAFLPPGSYEIEFTQAGFATVVRKATLNITERIAVDAVLQPSTVAEKIEVTEAAPLLQSETSALGRVVDGGALRDLPLSTRNFTQLLALSPGTSAPLNDAGALGRGTQNISSGGARLGSNAIYVDGVDAVNLHSNSASENAFASNGIVVPSPEAVQEFKVQTGLYDAQSGRSGGANVSLVTRSGSPQFHGSAFEFFRNDRLNANSFFFNRTGQQRPVLKQNQFGGTFGGPLIKDRTFFFFSYQGTRQRNGLSGSSSLTLPAIPLDRSRASLGRAFAGQTGARGGLAIAADGSNINDVAIALLNLKRPDGSFVIPSPQTSGPGVNYAVSIPARFSEDQYIGNADHQFGTKNRISFKSVVAGQPTFQPLPAANVPGFGTSQDFKSRIFSVSDTHVFSSRLVNEARMGVARLIGTMQQESQIPLSAIGMRRFNSGAFPDIPQITVTGAFSIGYSVNADQAVALTTWQYNDTLSYTAGKHEIRGGFEFRRYQDNYFSNNRMRGTTTFQRFPDLLLGLPGTPLAQGGNGTGFSNINSSSVASGNVDRADRVSDFALFVQDTWKASQRLTLTLGLRWEYLGFPVDVYGRNATFDTRLYQPPPAGGSTSAGFVQNSNAVRPVTGIPLKNETLVDNSPTRNFAPRFGLAYKITENLVMRGGYGIYFDRISNQLGLLESLSLPNYVRTDLQGAANISYSLRDPFPTLPLREEFPVVPLLFAPPYTTSRPALSLNSVDPTFRSPYLQQWGVNFQWQFLKNTVAEVGYVGTKGSALPSMRLANQSLLASVEAPVNGITTNTAANAQLRVPYIGFSPTGLIWLESSTDSRYNSLQASVSRRLSAGLRALASYTWGKSLDNNSGSGTGATFTQFDGDQNNLGSNRGPSDFDRTHRFVLNFTYAVPKWGFGWNETAVGKRVFSGWEIAGVAIMQSGVPFSILDPNGATLFGVTSSRASYALGATLETAQTTGRVQGRLDAYFNRGAFRPAGTGFGDTGRNILRGPSQRNFDFTVNKRIPLTEAIRMEWRTEFFNLFNFVNFATPGTNITATNFGVIRTATGNPRVIQLALKVVF